MNKNVKNYINVGLYFLYRLVFGIGYLVLLFVLMINVMGIDILQFCNINKVLIKFIVI